MTSRPSGRCTWTTPRAASGSAPEAAVVFRVADDPGNVIVMLEWDTVEHARDFAGSLELEQAMEWSTSNVSTPRVTVLDVAMRVAALSGEKGGRHGVRGPGA